MQTGFTLARSNARSRSRTDGHVLTGPSVTDLLATAKAQRWEPAEAMRALLAEELAGRQASSIRARRKAARFPTGKTFDVWDESLSSIPAPTARFCWPPPRGSPGHQRAVPLTANARFLLTVDIHEQSFD